MKRARFTEMQIVAILKEADSGIPVKDICRKYEISDATCYNWKSKYGGMPRINRLLKNSYKKQFKAILKSDRLLQLLMRGGAIVRRESKERTDVLLCAYGRDDS